MTLSRYAFLFFAVIILIGLSLQRNAVWLTELTLWHDVVKKSPNKARPYSALGDVYNSMSMFDIAIQQYQTAIRLNPDFAEAHNNLGVVYGQKGLNNEAVKHYLIAISLKPDYADPHFNIGTIYIGEGKIEDAKKEFEIVLQLRPEHSQALMFLNYINRLKNQKP